MDIVPRQQQYPGRDVEPDEDEGPGKGESDSQDKIRDVKKERNEVFGNPRMLEKWAREKFMMRRPNEEVYVIVDENNQPIESKKEE